MGAGAALRRGDIRLEHFKTDLTAGDRRSQAAQWAADETWVRCRKYENDPEYMECVSDILDHPVFQSMDQYIQHGTTTCKCHCIQVSYLAYTWCKRFGGNWRSAARAGLLMIFFYTTGIHMPGRQEIISMVLPIRVLPWKMQSSILN